MSVTVLEEVLFFSLALLVGLLIGLEREHHGQVEEDTAISGVRTFMLISVIGFVLTRYFREQQLMAVGIGVLLVIFLSIPMLKEKISRPGMTTAVALVIVLLIGMLVGMGLVVEPLVISLLTFGLIAYKEEMHRFAEVLTEEEINSALRFIAVAAVLLPLMYTIGDVHPLIGPGEVFDTVKAVLMIIFVSSMSFAGYLVIKLIGAEKGIKISTFLGGFVNSAAATASIAQKSKRNPSLLTVSFVSVLLTNTAMILKDTILISVLTGPDIVYYLAVPISALILLSVVIIIIKRKRTSTREFDLELGTPFAVIPAARFALLFTLISASAFVLKNYLGTYGVYAAAVGGIVSTTTVSASLGVLYAGGEIGIFTAVSTLLMALGIGSVSKLLIIRTYDRELMKKCAPALIAVTSAAFIIVALLFLIGK